MKQTKQLIFKVLKNEARLWNEDKTELNQTKLLDTLDNFGNKEKDLYENIISLLLQEKELKDEFFIKIKDVYVFKTNDFRFFMEENKIDNSYTAYKNRIGLSDGKKFLKDTNDVVLDFPYKDCVLEGGQSSEEGLDTYFEYSEKSEEYEEKKSKRKEIFFNQVLAHDEIDRLFDKKALVNWKRYTKDGEKEVGEIKRDGNGTIKENLIIKGNNLLALHSLKEQFAGKVKLIYIDPPYNTGNDGFKYNDNFNHSTWLTFMKNRLEIARELLKDDGVIFVQCDDNEHAYLKVLMDGLFSRANYLNTISVKVKESSGASGGGEDKRLKKNIENILCFFNKSFNSFKIEYIEKELVKYIQDMKESNTSFKYTNVLVKIGEKIPYKIIKDGSGKDIKIFKINDYSIKNINQLAKEEMISPEEAYKKYGDKIFATTNAQTSIRTRVWEATDSETNLYSIIYTPKSGKNKNRETELYFYGKQKVLLIWLKDTSYERDGQLFKKIKVGTYWEGFSWINVQKEGSVELSNGKKPEELLKRIIDMATENGDIILDYHLGSGTTCAVAHKIDRQYIGIEQMDYGENDSITRLKNVIGGDQSGISKSVDWKGGGDFVYCELAKWNETAKKQILECKNLDKLNKLFDEMYDKYFLNYNLKIKEFKEKVSKEEEFKKLSLDDQKKLFIAMLDNNQMYVNETEMEDKRYEISDLDQKTTSKFYYDKQ